MPKAERVVIFSPTRSSRAADAARTANARAAATAGATGAAPAVRVAIVCELCSLRMGGEAAIPFHYFRLLRARGVDAHLVAHARNARELNAAFAAEPDRLHLVEDSLLQQALWVVGRVLPDEVRRSTTALVSHLYTQRKQRRILRRLARDGAINVIHQPTPVSPAVPSMIHGCGAPVLIGPMNGDMEYPPAFRRRAHLVDRAFVRSARWVARFANHLVPGKRRAALLLAANARTEGALGAYHPDHAPTRLVENGVDLAQWHPPAAPRPSENGGPVRFIFSGRLIGWKGVDLILAAWDTLPRELNAELVIIGDGPERPRLESQHRRLRLGDRVRFIGWLPQPQVARQLGEADVLLHPSLRECGGSSVLEAMACGVPVIAVDWGGPADYVDASCGLLLPPTYPEQLVKGLAAAIAQLAGSQPLRARLGRAARDKGVAHSSWDAKVTEIVRLYTTVAAEPARADAPAPAGAAVVSG